jgi:hypothetical protein
MNAAGPISDAIVSYPVLGITENAEATSSLAAILLRMFEWE